MTAATAVARVWLAFLACVAVGAPWFTPYRPAQQFRQHLLTPPMAPHLWTSSGGWTWPFVYASPRVPTRESAPTLDGQPVSLRLGAAGTLVHVADPLAQPWFPLGTDHLGRDVWTRLVFGARISLSLAMAASVLSMFMGVSLGALAAWGGPITRRLLETAATCTTAVPLLYLVVFLRALLPLQLSVATIMFVLVTLFVLAAWPSVAVGVRALLARELTSDYVSALRAGGASPARVLWRVAPAARSFVIAQLVLWTPAFIVAESTLSFVGWGFPPDFPSWGTLLQDADDVTALVDYPWLLASAAAIASVSLAMAGLGGRRTRPTNRPI